MYVNKTSSFLVLLCLLFSQITLHAQRPTGGGGPGGSMPAIAKVYGKILDAETGEAVSYASVVLLAINKDTILAGVLSKENGDFALENLSFGPARLKISFLGYEERVEKIRITPDNMSKDLGDFKLAPDQSALKEVTIEAEKSGVQLGIDRRTYNVDKNLVALGGTALDALKVIPSISIDAEGNVELRRGTPRIFIDGKPTDLTLEQIPAQEIDRIEVITNPSVKYSAASTSGILNIVLQKNKMPGIFGMASLGVGSFDRYNAMVNLSIRQNPINFNVSYGLRTGRGPTHEYNYRTNFDSTGATSGYFNQDDYSNDKRTFQFGKVGLDWAVTNRSTLSLSENFSFGNMRWPSTQYFYFADASRDTTQYGTRDSEGKRLFSNTTAQLSFERTFPQEGKNWTSFVSWSPNNSEGGTMVNIDRLDATGATLANSPEVLETDGKLKGSTWQFQSDFINPVGDNAKWEAGIQGQYKTTSNLTSSFRTLGATGDRLDFPLLANNYSYDEVISAVYYNRSGIWGAWGYQGGLRLEQSWFDGHVPGSDSSFSYAYPSGLNNLKDIFFPALYLSKKLSNGNEVQVNFSRKLKRPNFWQLMPFIWQQDAQNYRSGNPNLKPEFQYVAETNYSDVFEKGSWLSSIYGRFEDNPITRVVFPVKDGSSALVNTFVNGSAQYFFGWEQTIKYKPVKWFETTFGTNISRIAIKADFEGQSYSNAGWNWTTKLNTDLKLPYSMTFQANGSYESPEIIPQGRQSQRWSIDLALAKKFGQIGSLTLSVNDLFNSDGRGQVIETIFYQQTSWNRRQPRFVQLTASFRLGKPDASIFRRGKGGRGGGGGDDGGFDM